MSDGAVKERGGVLGWVVGHPRLTAGIVFFLLAVVVVMTLDAAAGSRLRRRLDAIRAKGEPMSVEDLNREAEALRGSGKVGTGNRLVELAREIEKVVVREEEKPALPVLGWTGLLPGAGRRLPPEQLETAEAYLSRVGEPFAEAKRILDAEPDCIVRVWTSPMINMSMPEMSAMRTLDRTLYLDLLAAANREDRARVIRDLEEMSRLSEALECNTSLISELTRMGLDAQVRTAVEKAMSLSEWSIGELAAMHGVLLRMRGRIDLRRALVTERAFYLDTVGFVRSMPAGGGGTPLGGLNAWRYVPILPRLDTATGLEIWSTLIEGVARPDRDALKAAMDCDARLMTLSWYCVVSKISMPSLSRCVVLWVKDAASQAGIEAAVACERYRVDRGDWPGSLEALVPEFLESVPVDPFDGQPMRFARIPEGVKVWSIGEDRVDQGGEVDKLVPQKKRRAPDEGWVVVEPGLRGIEAEEATTMPSTGPAPR